MGALALGAVALGAGCGGEVDASSARAGQTDAAAPGASGALVPPDASGGSTTPPPEPEGGPVAVDDCTRRLADVRPEGDAPCSGVAGCADYKEHPGYVYTWQLSFTDLATRACVASALRAAGFSAEEDPQWIELYATASYEDVAAYLPIRALKLFTLDCADTPVACCGDAKACFQNSLCLPLSGSRWDPECRCWHDETPGCAMRGNGEFIEIAVTALDPAGRCWQFSNKLPVGWTSITATGAGCEDLQ